MLEFRLEEFAIIDARLFSFKACACSKIVLRGCFSFWSSQYRAPTWFNGFFSLRLLLRQIQIVSMLDNAIIFLLLPLLYTSESEKKKKKKSAINPKILGIWKWLQEMTWNDASSESIIAVLKFAVKTLEKYLWRTSVFSKIAG